MSKSDQFAVPVEAPASASPSKPSPLRIAGWGCAGIAALVIVFVLISWAQIYSAQQQPIDQQRNLRALAGVPLYPGAQWDEEGTRDARAALIGMKAIVNMSGAKMETVTGLRTSADPKEVIPYYDSRMALMGFVKTTLGSGSNTNGASYTSPNTTVIVQMKREAGEDNQLILYRFDRDSRSMLKQSSNVVTPQDIQKAEEEAKKKIKKQPESLKK